MKLTIIEDGVRSDLHLDQPVIRIGRSLDNDVRVSSTRVSRHHARIEFQAGVPWIEDLKSANGISVNGCTLEKGPLVQGDQISIGGGVTLEVGGESEEGVGMRTLTGESETESKNLRIFAGVMGELSRTSELKPLLRLIVDSAIELVGGERGFILLREGFATGQSGALHAQSSDQVSDLSVSVARSFDHTDVPVPRTRLSMGIAGRVITQGQSILSVDACKDERFDAMASVEDLRLRSILCLPILAEGASQREVQGVLYVDNRMQQGAFGQRDLELLELLAEQVCVALHRASLVRALQERNHHLDLSRQQIERLNDELGRKVRDREGELAVVREELVRARGRYDYNQIVGASDAMSAVFKQVDRIIESDLPVLIEGASGTGKELFAHAIHYNGSRKDKSFVAENCAALPDTLLESELFGHVRGAFTGAFHSKRGMLEQANGGTLFLDEIADMSHEMQKKLLRVLQEGTYRAVGSNREVSVNVRVIAASNRDLKSMVNEGTFREDLYYRLAVLHVDLPPLCERSGDVHLLAEHLLARAAREAGRRAPNLSQEALAAIVQYPWPGNVRELENEMRRLVVLVEGDVQVCDLSPSVLKGPAEPAAGNPIPTEVGSLDDAVARVEKATIRQALRQSGDNKTHAALALGISRYSLQRKMEKHGVQSGREDPYA